MNVAVTGGTGFIGARLVARLATEGHQVRVLSRKPERGAVFFDALAKPAPGLLDGCDAVINLAGEPISQRWTPEHKDRVLRSRVQGTAAIVEAARAAGSVKVLMSASAIGYYGPHGDEKLHENSPPGNDFLAEVCKAWEVAAAPAKSAGIRTVLPRIGVVLHPEGGALKQMLPLFKLGVGGRLGSGKQYMSWIHLDDVISLLLHALKTQVVDGPMNVTAPVPVTNADFTRALGAALHRPALFPAPAFALKLALGEMSSMILEGQRVMPDKALLTGFNFAYPTLESALGNLLGKRAA